ncbi:3-phosphoshikimate 1-carboxyvinyltransferase [Lentibacillus sp. JNUCC-1]|uniref:3-phosphoshikimate 1-carboxyvinyltransferase n=1 Tax=Lentibacillus sp. JNUCC-1 TaxID=2654513 RepID=UPI00132579EC|nr:3-phosphoshikimate 1-carboxyvinyltransferase [Lentibacillus sp. JNUCC-1]
MSSHIVAKNKQGLTGTMHVPSDKSISHRAVMLGSLAKGKTIVNGFLNAEDCLQTISCFRQMGVAITQEDAYVEIEGNGLAGLQEPREVLELGNSGTTIRLLAGILAGRPFHSVLQGDASLATRPMGRIAKPLRLMGAAIDGRGNGMYTPLSVRGGGLRGIDYQSPVASAQVKSAVLLAGLQAEGTTSVTEPALSRDHTERMLRAFGVQVDVNGNTIAIEGGQTLTGTTLNIPGDISSAAFFLVAGAVVPESSILIQNVGMNPTRSGIIDALQDMGASLTIKHFDEKRAEPAADLHIQSGPLRGIELGGDLIPRLIDEIPVIALAATQAEGRTVIKDAAELKVKETNRIDTVAMELNKMGAHVEPTDDGMIIHGPTPLKGTTVNSHGDHRIGMMLAIAGCIAEGETVVENSEAIHVSFPDFFERLEGLY